MLGPILDEACHDINKQYRGRVNLRVVQMNGGCRIDMEVMPPSSRAVAAGPGGVPGHILKSAPQQHQQQQQGTVWGTAVR